VSLCEKVFLSGKVRSTTLLCQQSRNFQTVGCSMGCMIRRWASQGLAPVTLSLAALACGGGGTTPDNPTSWSQSPSVAWSDGVAVASAAAVDDDGVASVCVDAPFGGCDQGSYLRSASVSQTRELQRYSTLFSASEGGNGSITRTVDWTVPALADASPLIGSVVWPASAYVGGELRVGFHGSDDYGLDRVFVSCISGGCASVSLDLGGALSIDSAVSVVVPEVGVADLQLSLFDDAGHSAVSFGSVDVVSPVYSVTVIEMTDHTDTLQSGTLLVDGVPYSVVDGAASFPSTAAEGCLLFVDSSHSNVRQSVQRSRSNRVYASSSDTWVNWSRESCVPVNFPVEDAQFDLFTMDDAWDYSLYEQTQANKKYSLDGNWRIRHHPHLCESANVTSGTGVFTLQYVVRDWPHAQLPENVAVTRAWLSSYLPELADRVRYDLVAEEVDEIPSQPHLEVRANLNTFPPGTNSGLFDADACRSLMSYTLPADTIYGVIRLSNVSREVLQALKFQHDGFTDTSSHLIMQPDGVRPSLWAQEAFAVSWAYGPVVGDFW